MIDWLTAAALPGWAAVAALHPAGRTDLGERWGWSVPPVQPGATWLVAASVGEVRAALALAPHLDGPVLITADTPTGAAVARAGTPVAARRPVDHPFTLAPLWADARPRRVAWVEGAWWPALHRLARRDGVPLVRVNGRPGHGTARLLRLGLAGDRVVARDAAAATWFRERGHGDVRLGGELKGDAPPAQPILRWPGPFAVAGSTRPGDEAAILATRRDLPDLRWLIAPRHPGRFDAVAALLDRSGSRWIRRSAIGAEVPPGIEVVLLDTIGELAGAYAGARVAFVGGSFDPEIGGHAPWEAARAGVPVVCGPDRHAHADAFAACGAIVADRPHGLSAALRAAIAAGPRQVVGSGAAARTAAEIADLRGSPPESPPRPWARPAAGAWRIGAAAWHGLWDVGLRAPIRCGVRVVSVGSANARSPGRTATVRWLVRELRARGERPGIALRGHRRAARGLRVSDHGADAAALGDEGAILAREGVPVAACADRVAAVRALADRGCTVVVLDDGLQHRRVHRDLDLVVVDGRFPSARGLLPMGEAREAAIPARAHGVIVHRGTPGADVAGLPTAWAVRRPGPWHRGADPTELPDGPIAAFAGIGRPADFLADLGGRVARFRALADHQPVDAGLADALAAWADGLPLACTDKDQVRLPEPLASQVYWRSVALEVSGAPEAWFRP